MTLRLASARDSDLSLYKDNVQVIEKWIDLKKKKGSFLQTNQSKRSS